MKSSSARSAALALYRSCLRSVNRIPELDHRIEYNKYVRQGFRDKKRLLEGSQQAAAALADAQEQLERMNYYHAVREGKQEQRSASNSISPSSVDITNTKPTTNTAVHQWLEKALPDLNEADKEQYTTTLLDDGFDTLELLSNDLVPEEDLDFMKKGHRRAIVRTYYSEN